MVRIQNTVLSWHDSLGSLCFMSVFYVVWKILVEVEGLPPFTPVFRSSRKILFNCFIYYTSSISFPDLVFVCSSYLKIQLSLITSRTLIQLHCRHHVSRHVPWPVESSVHLAPGRLYCHVLLPLYFPRRFVLSDPCPHYPFSSRTQSIQYWFACLKALGVWFRYCVVMWKLRTLRTLLIIHLKGYSTSPTGVESAITKSLRRIWLKLGIHCPCH